jgi:hypothetical protein
MAPPHSNNESTQPRDVEEGHEDDDRASVNQHYDFMHQCRLRFAYLFLTFLMSFANISLPP